MNRCYYRLILGISLLLKYCLFCSIVAQVPTKMPQIKKGISKPAFKKPTTAAATMVVPKPAVKAVKKPEVPVSGVKEVNKQQDTIATPTQTKKKKKAPAKKIEDIYKEGIDTIDEGDIGNWYLKRAAWKKARPRYEGIRKSVSQIEKLAQEFIKTKRSIDEVLNQFYVTVGTKQGEVMQILDRLIADLEKENELLPEGLADEQLKELVEIRTKKMRDLEILKANFDLIRSIDSNLNETILETLQEQLARVHKYQEEALENYYKISEILNDKKAKELLEMMNNYAENIQAIAQWLKGPLNTYVNESIAKLTALTESVAKDIEELRSRGIILGIMHASEEEKLVTQAREKEEQEKAQAAAKKKTESVNITIFQKIINWFSSLWQSLVHGIASLFSLGEKKAGT